ncbi:precorrin-3B C(17)-methyltransferase [Thiocapsa sp. UBA6158]|jgi:precorrin-3B C17-methyltransferase|uniref:precorrin-3B C(17)-methyltransferase n=1 Tax=Thiocapsa sp. UBA6158 TaxID=1947692 RepID=UPI0025E6D732|nr:precorrin-3B C(17)-methyltransferase [Thiocapsa sp. UBA6158]
MAKPKRKLTPAEKAAKKRRREETMVVSTLQGRRAAVEPEEVPMSNGKIYLVGLGPGDTAEMTGRARVAIAASDVVVGYRTYVRLIADLVKDKQVIAREMAEELDRCGEAVALAQAGQTVALVSSGDVGVFGMAGPLFELLFEQGWTPDNGIAVEVVPGVTAASSCASLVGAPLTHDFCAISLSDMLTPWPVIARRLEAAARADFVTALYNPKSSRRPDQLREARDLFLRHRDPQTPVAVVRAAYRQRQDVRLTTLAEIADGEVGMLTNLIIGNSSTFVRAGLMVTPRGYGLKYRLADGAARPGETARVSLSSGLEGWRRALVETALNEGVEAAARALDANSSQVLDALSEAQIAPWRVVRDPAPHALLEEALGWTDARLRMSSPGGGLVDLRLADARLQADGDSIVIDGSGWRVALTRAALALAYRVGLPSGEGVWFQDARGETLCRVGSG